MAGLSSDGLGGASKSPTEALGGTAPNSGGNVAVMDASDDVLAMDRDDTPVPIMPCSVGEPIEEPCVPANVVSIMLSTLGNAKVSAAWSSVLMSGRFDSDGTGGTVSPVAPSAAVVVRPSFWSPTTGCVGVERAPAAAAAAAAANAPGLATTTASFSTFTPL